MKYAVLTTKHSGGFCLWDSKVSWHGKEFAYDVAASGNKMDVVRAFMDACKKYDIAPCLYYCLGDSYSNPALVGRNGSSRFKWRAGNLPKDTFKLVKGHLHELAANYPECRYFWLDVPDVASVAQQAAFYDLLRKANPENVVLMNNHSAVGAATGDRQLVERRKDTDYPVDVLTSEARLRPKGVVSHVQVWQGKELFMGYEHCDTAGRCWFNTTNPKSVEELFGLYKLTRQCGGNLNLGIGPGRDGAIAPAFRDLLLQLKERIDSFEKSSAEGKAKP